MDRRSFLIKGASLLGGYFLGLSGFSHAYAFEKLSPSYFLNPSIALIIDDIGLNESHAEHFLQLNVPLSFAILPKLKYSTLLAQKINDCGHEVMLHQPMEPGDPRVDPGPGALYVGDNPEKINRVIEENIAELPLATGINNHMGSRFTESREKMTETLRVIKGSGLFFVDSRTSQNSKAYRIARTLHMPAAYRHIFLDNVLSEKAILLQLQRLTQCALQHGTAIGIGHPFPQTARALKYFMEKCTSPKVSFVHISKVLNG